MITENLSTLKIHKLTQEQYDRELAAGNIDETALYLTPDSGIHIASKTGESPVLNDSAAGGLKIDRICGGSKQEKTSGKQLLDMSGAKGGTSGGITVTVNDDGSYSYVGTATSGAINVWLLGGYTSTAALFTLSAGNYYSKDVVLFSYNGTTVEQYEYYFKLTEDTPITGVRAIGAFKGTIYNKTMYPMLNAGTEALPWEPYTGNIPSPNPEYPQPIVSAGEKLANGVQLFDKDAVTPELLDISNGAALNNSDWRLSDYIACKSLTNYYISESIAQYWQFAACFYNTNKEFISGGYLADNNIATPANTAYMRVAYSVAVNGVSIDRGNIMLNKGTTALPYEPYTGGVKKAYDVGISKKLTGKNLLKNTAKSQTVNGVTFTVNNNKSITISGTNDNTNVSDLYIYGSANDNGNYLNIPKGSIVSFEGIQKSYVELICREKETITYNLEQLTNLLAERDCQFYGIFLRVKDGVSANTTICPMIRYADIEDDTYEPYTEQTLTLNHVLRGIPLGMDIPEMFKSNALHMAGIYWNEEEQQYYIADTVDAEKGVRVQRIKCLTINSIGNDFGSTSNGLKWEYGHSILDSPFDGTNVIHYINVMNERFTMVSQQYENNEETGTCGSLFGHATYTEFRFRLLKSEYPTEDDAKNAILGTTVYYPLATPIETPLTDEEIIALHQLKTYQGVTHIFGSNDPAPTLEVEYGASRVGALSLENSNLHAVNEVLRRQMLNRSDALKRDIDTLYNDLQMKVYTGLSAIGLTTGVSIRDVYTHLEDKSIVYLNAAAISDPPEKYATIKVVRLSEARAYAEAFGKTEGYWIMHLGNVDGEWDELTKKSDLPYKIVIDDTAGTIDFIDR